MEPFGICYKENYNSFLKSVKLWQKNYGGMKPWKVVLTSLIFCLVFCIPVFFIEKYSGEETAMIIYEVALFALMICGSVYFCFYRFYIADISKAILKMKSSSIPTKEIVLRENDFLLGTGYRRVNYYYDEVIACFDSLDTLTFILDEYALPISIPKAFSNTQDMGIFCSILQNKLSDRYIMKGGK